VQKLNNNTLLFIISVALIIVGAVIASISNYSTVGAILFIIGLVMFLIIIGLKTGRF